MTAGSRAVRRLLRAAAIVMAVFAAAGCSRAMLVGSEAGPTYRITVHNEFAEAMIVSYNDGRGDALLGTVTAGGTDHFTIGRPATTTITVRARNVDSTRNAGPYTVVLSATTSQDVHLR
jgi:hypothetical protein